MNKKRNPTAVFQALGQVLLKYPEFRVGQAVMNALPARFNNDAFYIEDDELAECLRALADGQPSEDRLIAPQPTREGAMRALQTIDESLPAGQRFTREAVERLRKSYKFLVDVGDRPPFEYGLALDEIDALLEERDRLRGALERLMLSRDASWTGGHDWEEALDEAAAALLEEVGNE